MSPKRNCSDSEKGFSFANVNALWGALLAGTLERAGVRAAVISPGSRSTPLTVALAASKGIRTVPVLDERSAGFLALGMAKAGGSPVVLVCTSGTAGANYYPAVIEARESGVPLIVLTADRPAEMRHCKSGQTIDQLHLFGRYAVHFEELALPEARLPVLRHLRQSVLHAVGKAYGPVPGAVHLNVPFRDPLAPEAAPETLVGLPEDFSLEDFLEAVRAPAFACPWVEAKAVRKGWKDFGRSARGLIVAGLAEPVTPRPYVEAVARLAKATGWPVLAEGLSPLRGFGAELPALVTGYDTILRNAAAAEALAPEMVVQLGPLPTSKVLRGWLEKLDRPTLLVSAGGGNADPLHARTTHLRCGVEAFVRAANLSGEKELGACALDWLGREKTVRAGLSRELKKAPFFFEGAAVRTLFESVPKRTPVFVANSMPVRDVEFFRPVDRREVAVHVNRGANGIDGTLSTALGVAEAAGRPAVLLTGDLALLHDSNGLLHAPRLRGSLTVVLLNNGGGGIFGHLPIARFEPPFEEYFATPQAVDFATLCQAHGVAHTRVQSLAELSTHLRALPKSGLRVIEVPLDRRKDVAFRQQLFAKVAAAL